MRDVPASDATLRLLVTMTAEWFGANPHAVHENSSMTEAHGIQTARARMAAMYICRRFSRASYSRIGKMVGRHYSTVMNGESETRQRMERSPMFEASIAALEKAIAKVLFTRLASRSEQAQKERVEATA